MASGLPIVATRCLGVAAFAEHGYNCLLADVQACLCLPTVLGTWPPSVLLVNAVPHDGLAASARSSLSPAYLRNISISVYV